LPFLKKKTIAACPASFGRSFLSYLAKKKTVMTLSQWGNGALVTRKKSELNCVCGYALQLFGLSGNYVTACVFRGGHGEG
jgi:hypothetical protein